MKVIRCPEELRKSLASYGRSTNIGLVPTMGNLHEGHLALIRSALEDCDITVITIFVNPLQFNAHEDYTQYPDSLEADMQVLDSLNVEVLFCPSPRSMYPHDQIGQTRVSVPKLADTLCGVSRPGHFDGVTTIVAKLFHLIQPNTAFFGEKDWQQITIIRKMVADLNFSVEIVGIPTVRDTDYLALSSRNQYLSQNQRALAPQLYHQLCRVCEAIHKGVNDTVALEDNAKSELTRLGFRPEYVAVRDATTLAVSTKGTTSQRVFGAAYLGSARLIDNIPVDST